GSRELRRRAAAVSGDRPNRRVAAVLGAVDPGYDVGNQFAVGRDVWIAGEFKREIIFGRHSARRLSQRQSEKANYQAENGSRSANCVHVILRDAVIERAKRAYGI